MSIMVAHGLFIYKIYKGHHAFCQRTFICSEEPISGKLPADSEKIVSNTNADSYKSICFPTQILSLAFIDRYFKHP